MTPKLFYLFAQKMFPKKLIRYFFLIIIFFLFTSFSFAELNLVVTPIRYELKLDPGESINKMVTLRNRWTGALYITTWKTNIINDPNTYEPIFVENWNPNQELAPWITVMTNNFTIQWESDYQIEFNITVPGNATPWWHYWAVFFEYDSKMNLVVVDEWNVVNVKANYWLLILVEVSWEVIEWWWLGNIEINKPGSWPWGLYKPSTNTNTDDENLENIDLNSAWNHPKDKIDDCKFWDFSGSDYDWKCFDEVTMDKLIDYITNKNKDSENENSSNPLAKHENNINWNSNGNWDSTKNISNKDDFQIDFKVPFENSWNTHIKPSWKIIFYDEAWNQIRWIWIEPVIDAHWNQIWEKIVDYIPINPEQSNVLPDTKRLFVYEWKWFPYQINDENWEIITKYKTPEEYYSSDSIITKTISPWQKIYDSLARRKIKAITSITYAKNNWEIVAFDSEEEFFIEYNIETIWYDMYFIITVLSTVLLLLFLYFILSLIRRKKCKKCKKSIKKKMKVCPYCWTRQTPNIVKKEEKVEEVKEKKETTKKPRKGK